MTKIKNTYDLLIIGGGINGCGIAADAAMRGLSVCMVEQGDLASQTSSSSSKLIHGGLRYLEQLDFVMVKKALDERTTLMKIAPHLVRPLPFFIPYNKQMRPKWLIRLGLFIYDHLSKKNTLPKSSIHYRAHELEPLYFQPLKQDYQAGFTYYDAQTNDTRLTIANAQQAKLYGAHILPYHRLLSAEPTPENSWSATIGHLDKTIKTEAKVLINAAGPWVNQVNQMLGINEQLPINWIKGSHLVVKKLYNGDHAYLLQCDDKRIIFITPYYQYSMVGTTDIPVLDISKPAKIEQSEINYLLEVVNKYLNAEITENDIISTWSGIRPLIGTSEELAQKMSRDYQLHAIKKPAPLLSVYGGKITTYRQLAKQSLDKLKDYFPHMNECTTDTVYLPGGNIPSHQWESFYQAKQKQYNWVNKHLFQRYIRTYGSLIDVLLSNCEQQGDLGLHFGDDLYEREVSYLLKYEWASSMDDILRRIPDLAFTVKKDTQKRLKSYLESKLKHTLTNS